MENRINKIFTLDNGAEFMVLHQAIYNDDNYFVCTQVDEDDDLTDNYVLFHETKKGEEAFVEPVLDEALAKFIYEHLNFVD